MLIQKTLLNAELLTSSEMFKLIRRHGHQLWVVYTAIQVLQHEKDGQNLTTDDYDMICFFTGLDIEQVVRAIRLLLDNKFILGSDSEFFNQDVKKDLEKIVKKRNVYKENAEKRWKKNDNLKEENQENQLDKKEIESIGCNSNAMAMQLHCNGNANLLNMNLNTEHEDQNIESENKTKKDYFYLSEFPNVQVTEQEFNKLKSRMASEGISGKWFKRAFEKFDSWVAEQKKKPKSHYLAFLRWVISAIKQEMIIDQKYQTANPVRPQPKVINPHSIRRSA